MKNYETLEDLRKGLDDIDEKIAALLGERNALVKQFAKFGRTIAEVKADDRVRFVVSRAREAGIRYGVNPNLMEDLYRMMIDRMVDTELEEFQNRGEL